MWVFGGFGPSPVNVLNDHGNFDLWDPLSDGTNNQLLSFDPSTKTWTNAECFGDIPSPRWGASIAMVEDTVWLHGGSNHSDFDKSDFYELNMLSFCMDKD